MPYTLIKGSFHIHYPENPLNGPEPDGDTLKFLPDNRELIENLPRANRPPRFTKNNITTIRFEGIDALESHFPIEGETYHQRMDLAIKARDVLLDYAGFGQVTFFAETPNKVQTVENHPVRGYLLSNGLDTYGRTIAFVFTGDFSGVDGSSIFVEPRMLNTSLNMMMLKNGHAYPAFYLSLPPDLRDHLKVIVTKVRKESAGLWKYAAGSVNKSAEITNAAELQELVIWPKLFRRIAAFYQNGETNLGSLDTWLRADPKDRDDRILFPNMELGNMHDLISVNENNVSLTHLPEDIVIVPDDYILPVTPVHPGTPQHTGAGSIRIVAALINPKDRPEIGNETVTIINTTDSDINLKNWFIADRSGKQKLDGTLKPGCVMQVILSGSVRLSNERDTITILNAENDIIDQVSYEAIQLPVEGYTKVF